MKTVKPPFVRNPYNYDTNAASDESGLLCDDPSLTQQQFLEESDINYIADRYGLTGEMPQVTQPPTYGDFTGIFDFQTAQNAVRKATEDFMQLPAKLRTRFDNDPQKLLEFLDNEDNRAEAEFLGLANKRQSEQAEPAAASKGDPLSPAPKAAGEAPQTPPKGGKTDT